MAVPERY